MPLSMHFSLGYYLPDSPMRQFSLTVAAEDGRSTVIAGAHAFMRSLSANTVEELEDAFTRTAKAIDGGYFQPSSCMMAFEGNPYNLTVQEPNFGDAIKYGYWILYTLGEGVEFIGGSLYDMVSDDAGKAAALCAKENPAFNNLPLKERLECVWGKMYTHFLAPKLRRIEAYSLEEKLRSLRGSGEILDVEAPDYLWILASQNPALTQSGLFDTWALRALLEGKFVVDLATAQALGCLSKETDPYLDPRASKNAKGEWILSFDLPLAAQLWIFQEACDMNKAHAAKKDLSADMILKQYMIPEGEINLEKMGRNEGILLPYLRENKITGGFHHRYLAGAEKHHLDFLLEMNEHAKREKKPRNPYYQGYEHTYSEVLPTFKKDLPRDTSLELSRASQELKESDFVKTKKESDLMQEYCFNKRGRTAQEKFYVPNPAQKADIVEFFKTMGWGYFTNYRGGSGIRLPLAANGKGNLHPRLQRFLEAHGQIVSRGLYPRDKMSCDLENPKPGSENEASYYVFDLHCTPATLEMEINAFLRAEKDLAVLGEAKEELDYELKDANACLARLNQAIEERVKARGLKGAFTLPFTCTRNMAAQIVYRSYTYQRPYPFPAFIPVEKLLFESVQARKRDKDTPAHQEFVLTEDVLKQIDTLAKEPDQLNAFVAKVEEYNVPMHARVKAEESLLAKELKEVPKVPRITLTFGYSALDHAVHAGNLEKVDGLLKKPVVVDEDLNRCNPQGQTPLHVAILANHLSLEIRQKMLKMLVSYGANYNAHMIGTGDARYYPYPLAQAIHPKLFEKTYKDFLNNHARFGSVQDTAESIDMEKVRAARVSQAEIAKHRIEMLGIHSDECLPSRSRNGEENADKIAAVIAKCPEVADVPFYSPVYKTKFSLLELACSAWNDKFLRLMVKSLHGVGKLEAALQNLNWNAVKAIHPTSPCFKEDVAEILYTTCKTLSVQAPQAILDDYLAAQKPAQHPSVQKGGPAAANHPSFNRTTLPATPQTSPSTRFLFTTTSGKVEEPHRALGIQPGLGGKR